MQNSRVSTIRFNEWICVCAQYEKAVARIGRQVYQAYSRGLVSDYACMEMCKEISQTFADSKQLRADLEEELERDALRGLSVEEAKKAEEVLQLTEGQKFVRKVKLKMTRLMGRQAVNRSLQTYRDRVHALSRDLGLRALALHTKEPILKMESHMRLCQLAVKLDEDSNKKWEEIVSGKSEKGGMDVSFHHMLISFLGSFANFSRNTALGKMLLKMLKYNPEEEEKKLTKQFEGTTTAAALEAQMAEVEEPDLDIGREMASMQREYEETPSDWGLPPRPAMESWVPDVASTWSPDISEPAPAPKAEPAPPPPSTTVETSRPQVLRPRASDPGKAAWTPSAPVEEQSSWTAPAATPSLARIGQESPAEVEEVDDWAAEAFEEDVAQSQTGSRLGGVPGGPARLSPPALHEREKPQSASEQATAPSSKEIPLPPLPPMPSRSLRSDSPTSVDPLAPVKRPSTTAGDDPLLKLLKSDPAPPKAAQPRSAPPEPTRPEPLDGDDLLPAFLRDRPEEESSDLSGFIPDLPDSVDSSLKIIPFGTQRKKDDEGEADSFIPKMPE